MTLTTLPQNEILVQIITALGGTVRDAHSRNWLLEDWRDSIGSFLSFPLPSSFRWCRDATVSAWIGGNIVDERRTSDNDQEIITAIAPEGDFDSSAWSTHTSAGADPAFASIGFDQSGFARNMVQASGVNQLRVESNGELYSGGSNDGMYVSIPLASTTDISFSLQYSGSIVPSGFDMFISAGALTTGMQLRYNGGNIEFSIDAVLKASFADPGLFDGVRHSIVGTYNSVTGAEILVDGVAMTLTTDNAGAITPESDIYIMSRDTYTLSMPGNIGLVDIYDGARTSQELLDISDWISNKGLLIA